MRANRGELVFIFTIGLVLCWNTDYRAQSTFAEEKTRTSAAPVATPDDTIERFELLSLQWERECGSHTLSSHVIDDMKQPAALDLLKLGKPVIPLIVDRHLKSPMFDWRPWVGLLDGLTGEKYGRQQNPKGLYLDWWKVHQHEYSYKSTSDMESNESLPSDLKEAQDALDRENWPAAERIYKQHLVKFPKDAYAMRKLARALCFQATELTAKESYQKLKDANAVDHSSVPAEARMARFYVDYGDCGSSARVFAEAALKKAPDDATALYVAGRAALFAGMKKDADDYCKRLARVAPNSLDAKDLQLQIRVLRKPIDP
jgi:hypothetical protein